ncbi:MAG: 4-hydroxyphenylpyruvate dioxygenase, partial [Sphingomonadales bacterium]
MADLFENPIGTDGFDFVEYAAPDPKVLHALFKRLGFHAVARHKREALTLYKQGDVNFIINEEPGSYAEK